MSLVSKETMMNALDWAYQKSISGFQIKGDLRLESAEELAKQYLKEAKGDKDKAVNSLVNWQTTKCASVGFVTGLGGLITLPITIPANIGSVIYLQIRMVVAIAIIHGHDPKSDKVKTSAFLALLGGGMTEVLKSIGVQVGKKTAKNIINKISGKLIIKINQQVGMRLVTKFGTKGIVNLIKAIPVIAGLISAFIDASSTKAIASAANSLFCSEEE
ncbi:MAG: EcsC family protein [Fibrobacteres bacterium]|nr:EcsC family protein [Fibrobacterota bacterium]